MAELKKNVVIDIGNSRIKVAIFEGVLITHRLTYDNLEELGKVNELKDCNLIFSSVRNDEERIKTLFSGQQFIYLTTNTTLPISLDYLTPETLGVDRIAAVVGAFDHYRKDCLVIDAGSCITYDHINSSGVYLGGAIAPGLKMRMKSMHSFTSRLPEISESWRDIPQSEWGKSTRGCMVRGSFDGIVNEMNGFIDLYEKDNADLVVILTGGDANYFESKLKAPIFADFDLVLKGLNTILNHNK